MPFDPKHPLTTPRTLSTAKPVVDAMAEAIKTITDAGSSSARRTAPCTTPVTAATRPGSRSAAASATCPATPTRPTLGDPVLDLVTSGSSYIQAIAFRGTTGIDARTILTYSQYEDPASPWSDDQTQLFSEEQWVTLPVDRGPDRGSARGRRST